mmetsp:Transcript_72530/g.125861  ORF Transcript_72530/g.125861 Transcript_72530/m.125861 type:complete len:833 (-) Transcript_72530:86-2584(-)
MSWDWNDRDLLDWAKKTLPEFLLASMQDPKDREKVYARTPWECFEVSVHEVEIDGEATLTGKREQALFVFDLDMGMRIHIEKKIQYATKDEEEVSNIWPGIVQLIHFQEGNMKPDLIVKLDEAEPEVAKEVGWYMREGMGKRYIWHALARWQAYAVKKWCKVEAPEIEDPYSNPMLPPSFPPFKEDERRRLADAERQDRELRAKGFIGDSKRPKAIEELKEGENLLAKGLEREVFRNQDEQPSAIQASSSSAAAPFIGEKEDVEDPYESPPVSDDEDDEDDDAEGAEWELDESTMELRRKGAKPKMKKFSRFPFLPSMLCGVGGPATDWLRPKEYAIGHPEWNKGVETREKGRLTALDMILDKARKKREEMAKLANGKLIAMKALELCEAIGKNDVMQAFAKLDDMTANCPHPESGRCAAHYCVEHKNKELLEMVIQARADLNVKDTFGQTPLMMAARQSDSELSKMLLDGGADATEEDVLGRSAAEMVKVQPLEEDTPLKHWREKMTGDAIPEDPAKKSHELKSMIDEKERPKKYGLLLLDAIAQRDIRTAESSIEAGGDVNMLDDKGDSALLLLAKGKWKDQEGFQIRLAEKVHTAGANVNFQNVSGNSPLLYAAHRGNQKMAELLLRLKADPALTNSEGNTALMYAGHGGHESICRQLLEAYAAPAAKNKFGLTAEQMAQKKGFRSCAVMIQAYELAPKKVGDEQEVKKKEKKVEKRAFDYSKWNALEKEMEQDEIYEQNVKTREAQEAMKKPPPKLEDMGPEAFGLPADTPWPPADPSSRQKGPFDYSRWNRIVDDIERKDEVNERMDYLDRNPKYEWRNGEKMRVIF